MPSQVQTSRGNSMSLINSEIKPFKATAYHNGKFVTVTNEDVQADRDCDGRGRESQLERLRSSDTLAAARGRVTVANPRLLGEIGPRHLGAASVQYGNRDPNEPC